MKKILLISTGGTFNKGYNEHNGELEIDTTAEAIQSIAAAWRCEFDITTIIGKDSLDMTESDRELLLESISDSDYDDIVVIHGTDTMDRSAEFISESNLPKCIVFTGAMIPYSIDPVEATANLSSAFGYIQSLSGNGVYIAMNGQLGNHETIYKNRQSGRFELL